MEPLIPGRVPVEHLADDREHMVGQSRAAFLLHRIEQCGHVRAPDFSDRARAPIRQDEVLQHALVLAPAAQTRFGVSLDERRRDRLDRVGVSAPSCLRLR